jgi:uncharacterized membrane protein
MIAATSVLTQISIYILYILIPLIAIYIAFLIITKAFNYMGFTSFEAIIIVFVSFILGSGIVDDFVGISFSNIYLFSYGTWIIGINAGGAVIPIILSFYLLYKNKLHPPKIIFGIVTVAIITYFVTEPIPEKGIVAKFPFWLLPIFFASLASILVSWKDIQKASPYAYISGTIGVLIGADFFHLMSLLGIKMQTPQIAVIGGASIFDMVFITGILAVLVDGILTFKKRAKQGNQ